MDHTLNSPAGITPLTTPFGKIAMALSGGGFRAASYSIGAMSYLDHLKYPGEENRDGRLLDHVEYISCASGGSFAGMLYAARVREGVPFKEIYHEMLDFMKGTGVLEEVLKLINDNAAWENQDKNRNFINAFAKIYDRQLFKGTQFGIFWDKDGTAAKRTIEICVNATEFYRGISFRFQANGHAAGAGMSEPGKTGNKYIFFDTYTPSNLDILKKIKLGDILAASSCFPAGFEPIVYPQDFSYPADGSIPALSTEQARQAMVVTDYDGNERVLDTSFGMMDGGVDDNQGVYSAMLADNRRRLDGADKGFDLFIVTDVASYFMDPYVPGIVSANSAKTSIGDICHKLYKKYTLVSGIIKATFYGSLVALLAAVLLLIFADPGMWTNLGYFLLSPSLLLLVLTAFLAGFKNGDTVIKKVSSQLGATPKELAVSVKELVPSLSGFSNNSIELLMRYLGKSPVGVVEQLIKERLNSILSLVLDINLKQTRRLIFEIFYDEKKWENRRVSNVIYELSTFNKASRLSILKSKFDNKKYNPTAGDSWSADCQKKLTSGGKSLNAVAERARNMATTLWYDGNETALMKDIVACGQFTTCAKLLEHTMILERVIVIEKNLPEDQKTIRLSAAEQKSLSAIRMQLEEDWARFSMEPYFLYDQL